MNNVGDDDARLRKERTTVVAEIFPGSAEVKVRRKVGDVPKWSSARRASRMSLDVTDAVLSCRVSVWVRVDICTGDRRFQWKKRGWLMKCRATCEGSEVAVQMPSSMRGTAKRGQECDVGCRKGVDRRQVPKEGRRRCGARRVVGRSESRVSACPRPESSVIKPRPRRSKQIMRNGDRVARQGHSKPIDMTRI